MSSQIPVNIICGPLGSGKTTLIRNLMKQKPANEQWALLVNEFGTVGIDGAILNETGNVLVKQLPGGCICCSAQSDFGEAIDTLRTKYQPDRLIVEPTGLGEPDTLVDIFKLEHYQSAFKVETIFSVFDLSQTSLEELKSLTIMQNLLTMGDVIVLNKSDLVEKNQIDTLVNYCNQLYPPKQQILVAEQAQIDKTNLSIPHNFISGFKPQTLTSSKVLSPSQMAHKARIHEPIETKLPFSPQENKYILERHYKKQLGVVSIGWVFDEEIAFNWQKVMAFYKDLDQIASQDKKQPGLVKRAKGVFKLGAPWMLFQYVNDHVTREYIAYRHDSRFEILLNGEAGSFEQINFQNIENQLTRCFK